MAPKQSKASKRSAPKREPGASAPAQKKPRLPSKVQALHDVVAAANLPEACRDMVLAALPSSFMVTNGERHEIQRLIVQIVGEILDTTGSQIRTRVNGARERVSELERNKAEFHGNVDIAERAREDQARQLEENKSALASAVETLEDAVLKLKEAGEAKLAREHAAAANKDDLHLLTKALEEELPAITCGSDSAPSADDVNTRVQPLLRLVDLDKSLVIALPSACAKKVDDRGVFDKMVIDQLMATLKEKCAELAAKVAEADQAIAELAAAEEAARAKVSSDTELKCQASRDVDAASQQLEERESSLADSRANFDAHGPVLGNAEAELHKYENELQNFECYTFDCFTSLRDADNTAANEKQGAELQTDEPHPKTDPAESKGAETCPQVAESSISSKVPALDAGVPLVDVAVGGA